MTHHTFTRTILLVGLVTGLAACGGKGAKPAADPSDAPASGPTEPAAADTAGTDPAAPDPGTEEPTEAEPEATKPADAEAAAPAEPAKKKCAELDQSTCKVTNGCAWSTDKKCLDQ